MGDPKCNFLIRFLWVWLNITPNQRDGIFSIRPKMGILSVKRTVFSASGVKITLFARYRFKKQEPKIAILSDKVPLSNSIDF